MGARDPTPRTMPNGQATSRRPDLTFSLFTFPREQTQPVCKGRRLLPPRDRVGDPPNPICWLASRRAEPTLRVAGRKREGGIDAEHAICPATFAIFPELAQVAPAAAPRSRLPAAHRATPLTHQHIAPAVAWGVPASTESSSRARREGCDWRGGRNLTPGVQSRCSHGAALLLPCLRACLPAAQRSHCGPRRSPHRTDICHGITIA